jgi:hypothetical protein
VGESVDHLVVIPESGVSLSTIGCCDFSLVLRKLVILRPRWILDGKLTLRHYYKSHFSFFEALVSANRARKTKFTLSSIRPQKAEFYAD